MERRCVCSLTARTLGARPVAALVHTELGCYALDLPAPVRLPSKSNFQMTDAGQDRPKLVAPLTPNADGNTLVTFGKMATRTFHMALSEPVSPLLGFLLGLSSFHKKPLVA
jgi:hypothetical protein